MTGSHGGVSAARFALDVRAALYVFNDAGGGKEQAGVAGLDLLEAASIAAICVSHDSARIGEAGGKRSQATAPTAAWPSQRRGWPSGWSRSGQSR